MRAKKNGGFTCDKFTKNEMTFNPDDVKDKEFEVEKPEEKVKWPFDQETWDKLPKQEIIFGITYSREIHDGIPFLVVKHPMFKEYKMNPDQFNDLKNAVNYEDALRRKWVNQKTYTPGLDKIFESIKPPLGLRPTFIWLEERLEEIEEAKIRYKDSGKEPPKEWQEEQDFIINLEKLVKNGF